MKKSHFYFLIFILLFSFVFRPLLLNIKDRLLDWGDYPFVVWQINQSIEKIKNLNFTNFFETNAFYPNKLTLLFSDIFLPQAIMAVPLSFFSDNPILVFNIVFIITFLLNYLSSFLFWKQIFKKDLLGFFGGIFTVFSPFLHLQLGHFQMQSYWPFFFALYFLFKNEEKRKLKYLFFAGSFLAIQFLSSVYLSIFLIFTIVLFYLFIFLFSKKDEKLVVFRNLFTIFSVFVLLDGVFIKGYLDVKKIYNIKRDIKEYILYSAHLSDYLFSFSIDSLVHKSSILNRWNAFDKHTIGEKAAFPGFVLLFLAIGGILALKKVRGIYSINFEITREKLFFLGLIFFGFWFSLGPRINFNGSYAHIPTGYNLLLKYIPFLETVRATARWSFLFYIGGIYFSLITINKIIGSKDNIRNSILSILAIIFIFEYFPLNLNTKSNIFYGDTYTILENECKKRKKVVLEYPLSYFNKDGNPSVDIYYISKILLASIRHKCILVNGYSGYFPSGYFKLRDDLNFTDNDERFSEETISILKNTQIIKMNERAVFPETFRKFYKELKQHQFSITIIK